MLSKNRLWLKYQLKSLPLEAYGGLLKLPIRGDPDISSKGL